MDIPTLREFIRRLFRLGATAGQRHDLLDTIADEAILAQQSGKMMIGVNRPEGGVNWQMFMSWRPAQVMEIVDLARDYVDGTLEEALEEITETTSTRPNFGLSL